jgi:hypothetical protein
MERPSKNEYDEYYERYISLVEEDDIFAALKAQTGELERFFAGISEEKSRFSYAEGKWTIKEVLGHLTDTERHFSYRAFRISRRDETPIEGFEQDGYIENARFNQMTLGDLLEELVLLRRANLILFKNLTDDAWLFSGTASGFPVSVRALAFMSVGHIRHHLGILRERYLNEI